MEKILKTDKKSHLLLGYVSSVRFERYSQRLFQALDHFTVQKYFLQKRLAYSIGIVGKRLEPTTSKGSTKYLAKYFEQTLANKSVMF